jgi:hypothetical protein
MAKDIVDVECQALVTQQDQSPVDFLGLAVFPAARAVADAFASTVPMDPAVVRDTLEALLSEMRELGLKAELPLTHFHGGGMYARELVLPKGTFAIGEIQKYPHVSVISKGEISMLNEDGGYTRIKAPCTIVSKPGVRKCGFAHEETVWTTVHNMTELGIDDSVDKPVEELEKLLTASTQEEHALFLESRKMIEVSK